MGKRVSILVAAGALAVAPAARAQNWTLVWSDEFNGSSVNSGNWTFETGGSGWGNNELQYYTNGANASVSGGILTISATRGSGGFNCWYGPCQWTSTRMITAGKRTVQYGRVEARLAVPMGQGTWPAFWMLGSNIGSVGWPASGEIDIMEHVNSETQIHGAIHWDVGGHAFYGGPTPVANPAAYHVYAIEWNSSSIKWFVDGAQYREANIQGNINSTEEFHRPFFILLNVAIGGNFPGAPNSSTPSPARMLVDYVRVYQQSSAPPPPPPPPGGTISPTAWYNVINQTSGKCVDADGWGTGNGTPLIQWTCGSGQANQQWRFTPLTSGYYRVSPRHATGLAWDVSNISTAEGQPLHLWSYVSGNNQQWLAQSLGNGWWRFVARHSGKCLDVPGSSTANRARLQQWTCNNTGAQAFRLVQQ